MAFAAIDKVVERNIPSAREEWANGKKYVQWGDRNLFPEYLLSLYQNVTTLRGVVDGAVNYTVGDDVTTAELNGRMNLSGETVRDLVRKMADGFFADIAALVEARKRYDVVPDSPFGAMDALYGSLLAKRRLALALWDVKCEGLDFSGELASIVEGAYLSHFGKTGAGDPVLQAKLASAMVVAMLHYRLEAGEPFTAADIHAELDVLHRRVSGSR
jgi:hypothetical protein